MTVEVEISDQHVTLVFLHDGLKVDPSNWAGLNGARERDAISALRRLEARSRAIVDESGAIVEHDGIAELSPAQAAALGLPPPVDAVLSIQQKGSLRDLEVDYCWIRHDGRRIISPSEKGAFLTIGTKQYRVPSPLFDIVRTIEAIHHAVLGSDDRLFLFNQLKQLLPQKSTEDVTASGMLLTMQFSYGEAFSLDAAGSGADLKLLPILHRQPNEDEADEDGSEIPYLLPEHYQNVFAEQKFSVSKNVQPLYALGEGRYVALSRPLRSALQVVRDMQYQPPTVRREFLKNPRPWLLEKLGPDYDETVVQSVFKESAAYSDRVIGLGLWQPRVLPWVKKPASDWFGPQEYGVSVGGVSVPIKAADLSIVSKRIDDAIRDGIPAIRVPEPDGIMVPATPEASEAIANLIVQVSARSDGASKPKVVDRPVGNILIIEPNETAVGYSRNFVVRTPPLENALPSCLKTELKPHQIEGLDWLRLAWNVGRPGVLLADDMGLGKTLQTLAFLVLLKDAMKEGGKLKGPLLIVAPVGLLSNWKDEHNIHLKDDGLGELCEAYGAGLARLRLPVGDDGLRRLNLKIIRSADWVLTTYETLRDNQDDFAQIRFAAAIFDETQRVKTPGARVTDAAKGVHAEFTIALTGTPVENRLSDLWCIIDLVQPAYLGDLKSFSAKYENNPTEAVLMSLKDELEKSTPHTPRLMMRRMKKGRLKGLLDKTEDSVRVDMPPVQASAYQTVLDAARHSQSKGDKLKALQALRSISLHPFADEEVDDEAFIAASARLSACCTILDSISQRGEKALIFVEFLKFQAKLVGLFQRRYNLARSPMIISGEVAGPKRQDAVRAFQNAGSGFDMMILSPRAAGVGLTLTAANHVIHLTRWWNPAVEDQCTDRAHRIGQIRPVTVHLPIAVYPPDAARSFDVNLDALLTRKRKLASDLLAAPAPTSDDEEGLFQDIIGSGH